MTSERDPRQVLKDACDAVVADPTLTSVPDPDPSRAGHWRTFCNVGVCRIFTKAGWGKILPMTKEGWPLTANEMADWLEAQAAAGKDWKKGTGTEAHQHANAGRPAMVAEKHEVHGHEAVVYPGAEMAHSPALGCLVPWIANVGAVPPNTNRIEKVTEAFQRGGAHEPAYYLYVGNVV